MIDIAEPAIPDEVDRDRWGRPLIIPPGGGKVTPYTRCTTYVSALEDTYNLTQWKLRMAMIGLAGRPDLILSVNANRDDKDALNRIVTESMDAAKAGAAASIGTSLHKLTEFIDRGDELPPVPPEYLADLDAYRYVTRKLSIVGIERFTVCDDLRIGGTHDRTYEIDGRGYIGDLKTGSISYAALKIAMQLAVYAHSELYDHATGERSPLDVDLERAVVVHLPAGTGTASLHWVDIAAGWEAVQIATAVRAWRKRGAHLFEAFPPPPDLFDEIGAAESRDEVLGLWRVCGARWTEQHTAAAQARLAEIGAAA